MSEIGVKSAVLGLISSIMEIFNVAQEIYETASDAERLPRKFRAAAEQIPLVYQALNVADWNINEKDVGKEALQRAIPLLERCKESATSIKDIFNKTISTEDDSRQEELTKTVASKMKSNEVKEYLEDVVKTLEILAHGQVFEDTEVLKDIEKTIELLNNMLDEEQHRYANVSERTISIASNVGAFGSVQFNRGHIMFTKRQPERPGNVQPSINLLAALLPDNFGPEKIRRNAALQREITEQKNLPSSKPLDACFPSTSFPGAQWGLESVADENITKPDKQLSDKDHIRLLEILPGFGERIECRTRTLTLEQAKDKYEALSYTWETRSSSGNSSASKPSLIVSCDGMERAIRPNLYDALQILRAPRAIRTIWVDALSIDQDDILERNRQIGLMGQIFRFANRVLIWLGNCIPEGSVCGENGSERDTVLALSGIGDVVNTWRRQSELENVIPDATYYRTDQDDQSTKDKPQRPAKIISWRHIFGFYRCTWFHRVWVVQEAATARDAVVLCGGLQIAWEYVGLAAAIIRTNFPQLITPLDSGTESADMAQAIPTGILNAYFMYRMSAKRQYLESVRFSFHDLLSLTRQFDCTDDRDRIYGLLALPTTDNVSSRIRADYNKSATEVYREAANLILLGAQSLALLSSVQRPTSEPWASCQGFDASTPSWVPQWNFLSCCTLAPSQPSPAFQASFGKTMLRKEAPEPGELIVQGVILAPVLKYTSSRHQDFRCGGRNENAEYEMIPKWLTRTSQIELRALEDRLLNLNKPDLFKISMTLTAGKDWYGLPVENASAHVADYVECLNDKGLLWSLLPCAFGQQNARSELYESKQRNDELYLNIHRERILDQLLRDEYGKMRYNLSSGNARRFLDAAATTGQNRSRFTTDSGLFGIGPASIDCGDLLCVLYGADVPFILRSKGGKYVLIGECYVHDLMHGEVAKMLAGRGGKLREEWITLV